MGRTWAMIMSCRTLVFLLIGMSSCALKAAEDSDIVIHKGPTTSTPKLGSLTPSGANVPAGEIQIDREFRISRAEFEELAVHSPRRSPDVWEGRLPAVEALMLVEASIDVGDGVPEIKIRELKLRLSPEAPGGPVNRALEYYFVHAIANGSQVYRVVLMNGKVLRPKTVLAGS